MNDWARRRKRIILSIVLGGVIILVGVPLFLLFYERPNCSDGKQNGDETGLDCGGSCQRLCSAESLPLILKGDPRVLTIASSTYEVVAMVENPNQGAEIYKADYEIKVYDNVSPIAVKLIKGSTFIPKGMTFAIFEGPFTLQSEIVPTRATLEWQINPLSWQKNSEVEPEIEIREISLTRATSTPRLEARVENLSLTPVSNLDLVAVVSDTEGNIFAASKTFIETIAPGESASVIFSWPRPFPKAAAGIEIIKRVFPDRSFIR
jgi:hypothetical protein